MLQTLKHALTTNQIHFQRFAFAYCKKDPKALGGLRAFSWQTVDAGLRDILIKQLAQVVGGGTPEKCYEARFGAEPIRPAHNLVPGITREEAAQPVGMVMSDLVTGTPNLDDLKKSMGVLAAKYLAHPNTQTAVLCLVLFKLDLPQGGERAYSFLTMVDGEETSTILMYENDNLITKRLADIFRGKRLTRGAVYPWSYDPAYNEKAVYLHVEREVAFWSGVLECRRVDATSGEQREAVLRLAKEMGLSSNYLTQLKNVQSPVISGKELHAVAIALKPDLDMTVAQVTARFKAFLPQGLVERASVLESIARDLTVVAGPGIEIRLAPSKLDHIRQVRRGDKRYLVIDCDGEAVVTSGKGQTQLLEVDWDDFSKGR
jgi:hypothetical protein